MSTTYDDLNEQGKFLVDTWLSNTDVEPGTKDYEDYKKIFVLRYLELAKIRQDPGKVLNMKGTGTPFQQPVGHEQAMEAQRPPFRVQTRTIEGELKYFDSLKEAMAYAQPKEDVWKVSFPTAPGERCRLIRQGNKWVYENIMDEVFQTMKTTGEK